MTVPTPRWAFDLVDGSGVKLTQGGLLEAASYTAQRGTPAMVQSTLDLNTDTAAAVLAAEGAVWVKGYRTSTGDMDDAVLRFYGPMWFEELLGSDEQGDGLTITALDPLVWTRKRFTSYAGTADQGAIIKSLIDTTNSTDGETGIDTDAAWVTATSSITVDFAAQIPTLENVIQQFQDQLDGCEVWIDPIELSSGKIGRLYVARQRGSNTATPGLVFAYGDGTPGNLVDLQRVRAKDNIENDAYGSSDVEGVSTVERTDATSISTLGRLVGRTTFTGEPNAGRLGARTQGRINRLSTMARVAEYTATVGDGAPALFDDFDIGDVATLMFRRGSVEWEATQRIYGATVQVDEDGFENLSDIQFGGVVV